MEPIVPRTRVALGIKRHDYPAILMLSQSVHDGMSAASTLFPSPNPTMAAFAGQIQDLRTSQQAVVARTPGAAALRNVKGAIVFGSLECLQTYVQTVCDASPEQAHVILAAAAMKAAASAKHAKAVLAASDGTVSGTALLEAHRALLVGKTSKRVTLNWQYSLDGGKTWTLAPSTPLARTEIAGLPALTTVLFRVSATVGNVAGPWSQAVSLLVK